MAESTGGVFWKTSDGESLSRAYTEIDQLEKSAIVDATVTHHESVAVFPLFLFPALLLMLGEMVLGATLLHVNQECVA